MLKFDLAKRLQACKASDTKFTPQALGEFFGLPKAHFHQLGPGMPIVFYQANLIVPISYQLRGTIFFPDRKEIVRGHPRVLQTSDYSNHPLSFITDHLLASSATTETECVVEPKLNGATIRVYSYGRDLYCATDVSGDGGNPLVGAGIDNSRSLGIDYGGQAARILGEQYPGVERLAKLGYVPVFVLQIPEFAHDQSIDRSDMILVDVIDPDYEFVDRLERERIAEDYALNLVDLEGRIALQSADPMAFIRRCRALEHQATQQGGGGFVVKGQIPGETDQLTCKIEPSGERDRARDISTSDLAAVTDEITVQFGDNVWAAEEFSEGLILDFLGSHHRSVVWKAAQYLQSWRDARRLIGLEH